MRYGYAYRTSDGVRHEAHMDAESRDAVFAALRARGIRPIKVVAADGSKANGEIHGVRRRALVSATVAAALLAAGATVAFYRARGGASAQPDFETAMTRRQVIGDSAVIEKGIRTGWSDVFADEGERFLASFAIPGVEAGQRNTKADELKSALERKVAATAADGIEARQIKAMVEGMKEEARAYVAAGGSLVEYGRRLTERQDKELSIYRQAKIEAVNARATMSSDEFLKFWEERNASLRDMGIRLLPLDD